MTAGTEEAGDGRGVDELLSASAPTRKMVMPPSPVEMVVDINILNIHVQLFSLHTCTFIILNAQMC